MKTVKVLLMTVLIGSLTSSAFSTTKIKGNSNTEMGKYLIEEASAPMILKGQELKTYKLAYENLEQEILIGVEELETCKNFHVVIDDMEIIYACEQGVFGVRRLPKKRETKADLKVAIDKQQYYYQKVITQKPKTEEELLGLIACYYPILVKPGFLLQQS